MARQSAPQPLPPPGDWNGWVCAGRGCGKNFTGQAGLTSWLSGAARPHRTWWPPPRRMRATSWWKANLGCLRIAPPWKCRVYEPSKRRLTWQNGAIATLFSAARKSDRLRGPEMTPHGPTSWPRGMSRSNTWDMLQFGMRLGKRPRWLATTTPRPIKLLKALLARQGTDVVVTRGNTFENEANLAPTFLHAVRTDMKARDLAGKNQRRTADRHPGALWHIEWLDRDRVTRRPNLRRIVVAIDPAVSNNEGSDETGIIVAGIAPTSSIHPRRFKRAVCSARVGRESDRTLSQTQSRPDLCRNKNGGEMVEATIRALDSQSVSSQFMRAAVRLFAPNRLRRCTSRTRCITSAISRARGPEVRFYQRLRP